MKIYYILGLFVSQQTQNYSNFLCTYMNMISIVRYPYLLYNVYVSASKVMISSTAHK